MREPEWNTADSARGVICIDSHPDGGPDKTRLLLWADGSDQTWTLFARRAGWQPGGRSEKWRKVATGHWPVPRVAEASAIRQSWVRGELMAMPDGRTEK